MLQKLKARDYHILSSYQELAIFPMIHAVCLQLQQGHIFVDDVVHTRIIFVINKAGFAYLHTPSSFTDYNRLIAFFSANSEIPDYFHIYSPPMQLTDELKLYPEVGYKFRSRIQFRYNKKNTSSVTEEMSIFKSEEITATNIGEFKHWEKDLFLRFWKSETDFLLHGYGIIVYDKQNIAGCICYATCVADKVAEIDIFTKPDSRKIGLAAVATKQFIILSNAKDIAPNWDCFEDNHGSLKTAYKAHFDKIKEYLFLSIYFKNKSQLS